VHDPIFWYEKILNYRGLWHQQFVRRPPQYSCYNSCREDLNRTHCSSLIPLGFGRVPAVFSIARMKALYASVFGCFDRWLTSIVFCSVVTSLGLDSVHMSPSSVLVVTWVDLSFFGCTFKLTYVKVSSYPYSHYTVDSDVSCECFEWVVVDSLYPVTNASEPVTSSNYFGVSRIVLDVRRYASNDCLE
jgi:hypothetical protein